MHGPLLHVMEHLRKKYSSKTYRTYAQQFLAFDTYAEQQCGVLWNAPAEQIQETYLAYLKSFGAEVTTRHEVHTVLSDSQLTVAVSTLALQHEALRTTYAIAMELGLYRSGTNPLSSVRPDVGKQKKSSYWESNPIRAAHLARDPERYFRFQDAGWVPALLMDNMQFAGLLTEAFDQHQTLLRDRSILALTLTSGVRIAEACSASLQGWALLNAAQVPFQNCMRVTNKGSGQREVKPIAFPGETAALLRRQFMEERPQFDPEHQNFLKWARDERLQVAREQPTPELYYRFVTAQDAERRRLDPSAKSSRTPLFLTRKGAPYSPASFRQVAWGPALKSANLRARPHQTRHWFTTLILIRIEQVYRLDRPNYQAARQSFGRYMMWANIEAMLDVYDRALEQHGMREQWPLIARFSEAQLELSGVDMNTFLQEINSLSPEEEIIRSDVQQTYAEIQTLLALDSGREND